MAGRGRGIPGGDGYESYDYTYDYGHDSAGLYSFVSESRMNSYPMSSNDEAKRMGPGRDSYGSYNRMDGGRYGFSEPERQYGNQRAYHSPYSSQSGWTADARGRLGANFRPLPGIRGPMPMLSQGTFQDRTGFQELRAFTGNSYFGGGFKQKSRKLWKDKKKRGAEGGEGPPEKKIKSTAEDDEAKSDESESGDANHEGAAGSSTKNEAEDKPEVSEETDKEQKQSQTKKQQDFQSRRLRDRMVERIQFVCSLCKFRTFYHEEMSSHLQSDFHKQHFRYVGVQLPKQSADFLQEYVSHKAKKTEERRNGIEDLSTTIQQIYRDQDLTQELGMEHFVKKVEASHCAACDVFIPMNGAALRRHIRTSVHNQNRRNMMENSKKTALAVARSILNNKMISQKLERYIKGQNPFTDEQDEAPGSSTVDLEALVSQESEVTLDTSCENEDSPSLGDPAASVMAPEMIGSGDASDAVMVEEEEDGDESSGGQEASADGGGDEQTEDV